MARITRTQLDELARALSARHQASVWLQHSSSGYAIMQDHPATTGAWQHAAGLTASEAKHWLSGALAVHSITTRASEA